MNRVTRITALILLTNLLFRLSAVSQEYIPYQWDDERALTMLNQTEEAYDLYYIQKTEKYQYVYDPIDGQFVCYITNHNIIRVNNDEALSQSNRVYIPMRSTIELSAVKARVINKDGRVVNFDENNIKELEEDESGFKILAMEGAEVGGEIEYYYTRKTNASNTLTRYFQLSTPIKSYDFTLQCPENLEYAFKAYNHDSKVIKMETDTSEHINLYRLKVENIPALYEEDFSSYENSKKRLEVKLAYNSVSGKARINTWGDAGKIIYNSIYNLSGNEQKEFAKFVKKINYTGNPIDAFKRYEHYIKTNFFFEEEAGDNGSQLEFILKNKYATSKGFTKLYAALLNHLDIQHEIVLASDKDKRTFDSEFDTWNYLDEYLIYINTTKQFLSPKITSFRLGTISTSYLGTQGLFVRPEKIQDYEYPISHISDIPAPRYTENFDNMDIAVAFSEDSEKNLVDLTRSYTGYSADYYKYALLIIEEEQKKEMLDDVIKYLAGDADIKSVEITETNATYDLWDKPFTVKGTFETDSYIESAGDIILFKVGELIGLQSELYQENERRTQIVNQFNRGYLRKIKIEIPDGYTIKNPNDLIIQKQVLEKNNPIFSFISSYTIDKQILEITIEEYYDRIYYPVDKFEEFREVINAAADWNKIVLVLEE